MLARAIKTIEDYSMLSPGERVVVGVSGGADSMALLHILTELNELKLDITVAHLNHGIRGEEAERDSRFVEQAAGSLGLRFEHKKVDTIAYKEEKKLSLEDAARELRYEFFNEVRENLNASKVATAHTQDDQAETVLMRLIRGSGLRGLSGIPPVSRGYLIRPLLFVSRIEIEEYLTKEGIEWIEDSSNISDEFLRNRVRNELVPALEAYNPKLKETLARTAELLRSDAEFINSEAEKLFKTIFRKIDNKEFLGNLDAYRTSERSLRLSCLRLSIESVSESLNAVSYTHVTAADEFLLSNSSSGEVEFPGEAAIAKGYNQFIVTRKPQLSHKFSYIIESPGKSSFPEFQVEIEQTSADDLETQDESTAYFAAESIKFPIYVRGFTPGDRFIPLGMKNYKKVQDYFTDVKLPRFLRYRVPIFLSQGEIFWIGGMRIDERAKVKSEGEETLRFKLVLKDYL
jgi:tRNA(Ile)-lysidine synthase